jgi:hypothetical protein
MSNSNSIEIFSNIMIEMFNILSDKIQKLTFEPETSESAYSEYETSDSSVSSYSEYETSDSSVSSSYSEYESETSVCEDEYESETSVCEDGYEYESECSETSETSGTSEEWKLYRGYSVSNRGNVKNKHDKFIMGGMNHGYRSVNISGSNITVARLVYLLFSNDDRFDIGSRFHHIKYYDGDNKNINISNLYLQINKSEKNKK